MKLKRLISSLLALAAIVSMAGCNSSGSGSQAAGSAATPGSSDTSSTKTIDNSKITVAYVTSSLTTQIFRDQVQALQDYSNKIGIKFLYTAKENTSDQITACENYISMHVNVLMVHVTDEKTFKDVMKKAQDAGVKWFSYDSNITGSDAYYGWNNYDLGYAIGQNAANWVNKTFSAGDTVYAASCNYPDAPFLVTREKGYKDAVNKLSKAKVEWVATAKGGTTDNGVTAGENFLQCGKKINLVVGINDSGCCGVYQAFTAAKYGGDKVGIFACDSDPEALKAIAVGGIYRGSISTGLVKLAPDFINICVDLANGQKGGEHWGKFTAITKDNVKDFM